MLKNIVQLLTGSNPVVLLPTTTNTTKYYSNQLYIRHTAAIYYRKYCKSSAHNTLVVGIAHCIGGMDGRVVHWVKYLNYYRLELHLLFEAPPLTLVQKNGKH